MTTAQNLSWWKGDAYDRPGWLRHGVAVAAVLAALLVRFAIDPLVHDRQPFVTFYAAVALASWFGGLGPGLVAVILGFLAGNIFFLTPSGELVVPRPNGSFNAMIPALTYAGVGVFVVFLGELMHRANREAHKQTEAARASEERFRALAENIPQLAWITQADGWITWYNRRWFDYTGTTLSQMEGWGWQAVHHPDHLERVTAGFKKALAQGAPWEDTFPLRRHDGQFRWFLSRAFPIRDNSGTIVRWFGTNTDITELRETEEALRGSEERYRLLNRELEARVAERTAQLTSANERLTEANEKLQEVDRLKSEFLAMMSHELRTPLNSIIGFNEIIAGGLAGPINEEQKTQLGMALNSARHLLQLINDLLDLARIESGRAEVMLKPFSIAEVVQQVHDTLKPLASKKRLSIETTVEGSPVVSSDRKKVFQVLLNLANNAVKFTEAGRIGLAAEHKAGMLTLRVSDTGIGIKKDDMRLLFEAFRQVDGSARRRFEGTGLGLHLSKRLVELLGGSIRAESDFGSGSVFTVELPMKGAAP